MSQLNYLFLKKIIFLFLEKKLNLDAKRSIKKFSWIAKNRPEKAIRFVIHSILGAYK
ncbi:hypothetical protein [Shivajiella indica]|uniref:Uncharacterized protein n=1 Tax=Shivajiella indica TaxID=872115 RepID=A0ABW5B6G7_9BACT